MKCFISGDCNKDTTNVTGDILSYTIVLILNRHRPIEPGYSGSKLDNWESDFFTLTHVIHISLLSIANTVGNSQMIFKSTKNMILIAGQPIRFDTGSTSAQSHLEFRTQVVITKSILFIPATGLRCSTCVFPACGLLNPGIPTDCILGENECVTRVASGKLYDLFYEFY